MHEWNNTALALVALIASVYVPVRLFRIATYPVPQIQVSVVTQDVAGIPSPYFSAEIRHTGEKTTIVRPEFYVFVREPDLPAVQKPRWWRRREWFCFYKRILDDIPAGRNATEPFGGPAQSPATDFMFFAMTHFARYFEFYHPMGPNSPDNDPYLYRVGRGLGTRPIPMLVRIEYQLGLSIQSRQIAEHEFLVTMFIPNAMTRDDVGRQYVVVSADVPRLAWVRKRFLRTLSGREGITAAPPQ